MKVEFKKAPIIFILFFLNILPAMAQNILSNDDIEKYIAVLPLIHQLSERFQSGIDKENKEETMVFSPDTLSLTPITDNLTTLENHQTFEEFNLIITKAGFLNSSEWANVGDRIMMAYSANQLINPIDDNAPSINFIKENMQTELANVEKNQFISAEQKLTLINKIQKSMALLNNPNYIDNENITIIGPYIERLNSFFKEYQ
ncbi:MAG: hypothetical protein JKY84_08315 [Emcibacteraceae bacterium]|nr:hypothetical protein [Emcibacteraceae bacterium]